MNKRLDLMENGPVRKALWVLGMPTMIGLLMTGFYNFVDSYFVAKLGTEAMSALSIVYPLVTLMPGIGLLFGNGGSAFISELLGARQQEKAEVVLASTFFYCLIFSLCTQGLLFFLPSLLRSLGASQAVLPLALDYASVLVLSFVFHIPSVCLMNLVRAEGAIGRSTASQLVGAFLNIVLDPILIFTFGMGIKGAALATAISQLVSCALLLEYYVSRKSLLRLSLANIRFQTWIFKPVFKVGFPLFAINLFQSISLSALNVAASAYGDAVVAALGIVNRILGMTGFAITGFSRGFQTFIAYNYGAGHLLRVRQATSTAYRWGMGGAAVLSVLQIALSRPLVGAFSQNSQVLSIGVAALCVGSVFLFSYGFQSMAIVYLLTLKHSAAGFLFSICRQGLVFLPMLYWLDQRFPLYGLYYVQGASDLLTTLLIGVFMLSLRKKTSPA